MTTPAIAARRRVLGALGLGPLWVRRNPPGGEVDVEDADQRALRIASMDAHTLRASIATCVACELSRGRTNAVFGDGADGAPWFVVGEAPGADDDATGTAFSGPVGRLLDAMLSSVGRSRASGSFVTQVVKCRPPTDRAPTEAEVACCRPYLQREIALQAPRLVLAVGDLAASALLGPEARVSALRGSRHVVTIREQSLPIVVTHGPSRLAAAGEAKPEAWADLRLALTVEEAVGNGA